ncbi:GntR family transcriptional regulator [Enterococcus hulanensis]|uniref:GntR family transcriptional regulator n=1 Tax=Enterococcus hulanensis TaxID=2559929 RepID=UPI001A8D8DD1|nr:GntR family transcriptional regulator [Enterococcus hulanensis]MBO0456006.1 GntR family transcriptional regulator [Enterococcus hulanensis]
MDKSLKVQAYNQIKKNILSQKYKPNSIISESSLLTDLDMSRTPVRESLIKLEQENFIEIIAKKGIIIKALSLQDVNMMFETRILIEPFLIEKYNNFIDLRKLEKLKNDLVNSDPSDVSTFLKLDNSLHDLICMSGPNNFLNNTLKHIYDQHNRLRVSYFPNVAERFQKATNEHIQLCEAILNGEIDLAVDILKDHLTTSKIIAVTALLETTLSIN